jgi:hypothetical protein
MFKAQTEQLQRYGHAADVWRIEYPDELHGGSLCATAYEVQLNWTELLYSILLIHDKQRILTEVPGDPDIEEGLGNPNKLFHVVALPVLRRLDSFLNARRQSIKFQTAGQ